MDLEKTSDLYNEAAEAAANSVRGCTVPLFKRLSDDHIDFEGTGVLVRLADHHFLFSAAHVFEKLTGGVFLLAEGRERHPLESNAVCVSGSTESYDYDVGYILLTTNEVNAIGAANFLASERLATLEADGHTPGYLAVGFPAKFQYPKAGEDVFMVNGMRYHALECKRSAYDLVGVSRSSRVIIQYDRNKTHGPKGVGGSPSFVGISGCGIWRLNPLRSHSPASPPELVAILTDNPTKYRKGLLSTRVGVLLAALVKKYPVLSDTVKLSHDHCALFMCP